MLKFLPISTWIQTGCTFICEWFSELSNTLSGRLLSRVLTLEGLDDKNDYYSTFDSTCYSFGPCKLMVAYKTFSKRKYSISQIEFNLIMLTNISKQRKPSHGKEKGQEKSKSNSPFRKLTTIQPFYLHTSSVWLRNEDQSWSMHAPWITLVRLCG